MLRSSSMTNNLGIAEPSQHELTPQNQPEFIVAILSG
jgi:hypothetical protein